MTQATPSQAPPFRLADAPARGQDEPPIVFYDGDCGLCQFSVQWLIKRDPHGKLLYAPLQGETAAALFEHTGPPPQQEGEQSMLLWDQRGLASHSTGALRSMGYVGWPWKAMQVFLIVPRFIRDTVYRFIARNRYRWFGKKDACKIPSPEERKRFLP